MNMFSIDIDQIIHEGKLNLIHGFKDHFYEIFF